MRLLHKGIKGALSVPCALCILYNIFPDPCVDRPCIRPTTHLSRPCICMALQHPTASEKGPVHRQNLTFHNGVAKHETLESKAPGAMMTTSMPKGFNSRRRPSETALRPALLAEYAVWKQASRYHVTQSNNSHTGSLDRTVHMSTSQWHQT